MTFIDIIERTELEKFETKIVPLLEEYDAISGQL